MTEIHIRRSHALGLPKARERARAWAARAAQKFDLACRIVEGEAADRVEFTRSGVSGTLTVGADHVDVRARLGLLLSAFGPSIEAEIRKNLDALLVDEAG